MGGIGGKKGRNGRVLVQVWLPKELVKRLEHACIDLERKRHEVIEEIMTSGIDALAPPATGPAEGA